MCFGTEGNVLCWLDSVPELKEPSETVRCSSEVRQTAPGRGAESCARAAEGSSECSCAGRQKLCRTWDTTPRYQEGHIPSGDRRAVVCPFPGEQQGLQLPDRRGTGQLFCLPHTEQKLNLSCWQSKKRFLEGEQCPPVTSKGKRPLFVRGSLVSPDAQILGRRAQCTSRRLQQ